MLFILQTLYFAQLFMLLVLALKWVLRDKYASMQGKLLGAVGVVFVTAGADSAVGDIANAMGMHNKTEAFRTLFLFSTEVTLLFICTGGALLYIAVCSWVFTPEESRTAREADEKAQEDAAKARGAFHLQGTVMNMRNHVKKGGFLSETERFTEIETTMAIFVVNGEVDSMAKGLGVYVNDRGQLRVGDQRSRTFYLRGSLL